MVKIWTTMLKMSEELRMKIVNERNEQKAVNLTWVVIILALVALLEGIQRGGLIITL